MPLKAKITGARLKDERGFTMLAVLGAMLAIMGLSAAAFAAANGDQNSARRDQDHKRAYSAAEAGVAEYLFRLNQDSSYWTKCDQVLPPAKVNQPWNGSGNDPRVKRTIAGTDATYALELRPAAPATLCDTNNPVGTMINASTGTFGIRSTGFARATKRSINATFRRRGFLDYLYFTDYETMNPVVYRVYAGGLATSPEDVQAWATRECGYYRNGRSSKVFTATVNDGGTNRSTSFGCIDINFITGDLIGGPLHTNDQLLVCGSPKFGRDQQDAIEVVQDPGWRGCGSGGSPTFDGTYEPGSAQLDLPPSNSSLKAIVDPGYVFSGRTKLAFSGTTVTITDKDGAVSTKPLPPSGVIYVQNDSAATCAFYDATATEPVPATKGCGDAYVSGSYDASITVAAEKDVIVDGDFKHTGNAIAGLIANNFVRVDHQVENRTKSWNGYNFNWSCNNKGGAPVVRQIDAAILSLQHSFIVDNWYCGAALGTLTVNGATAQKYRGPVGTFSGGSPASGYSKNYLYDDRLRYRQPPHFLDPVQSSWRIVRQTEQLPAR